MSFRKDAYAIKQFEELRMKIRAMEEVAVITGLVKQLKDKNLSDEAIFELFGWMTRPSEPLRAQERRAVVEKLIKSGASLRTVENVKKIYTR